MDNITIYDHDSEKQVVILKFMEVTECETYQEAKFFVAMHEYNIKDAVSAYMLSKGYSGHVSQSIESGRVSSMVRKQSIEQQSRQWDNYELSLSPEQTGVLQKRLRSRSMLVQRSDDISQFISHQQQHPQSNSICTKVYTSFRNSFKCLDRLKQKLNRKINSMRGDADRIYYFQQIYHLQLQQAGLLSTQNALIEGYELGQIEESQKLKVMRGQYQLCKPIFVVVCPNRKGKLVTGLLGNRQLITFVKEHFQVLFITLSELKELKLARSHVIRNIRKCPTVIVYMKNIYDLEDVLMKFEGEEVRDITVEKLKEGLKGVTKLQRKWEYLVSLQRHLRENAITSLSQVAHQSDDYDPIPSPHTPQLYSTPQSYQHPQTKRSLIQQQTQIYEQLVAEQHKRKNSIEQQKRKFEEIKEMREIRRMSLPEEPVGDLLAVSVQVRFRCPVNGEYITRRFLKQEKVDILYQFVDTSDDIEFQTQPQRNFDLFTSFPPTSLSQHRQSILSDIFDQQKQTILIRQI